MKSQKKIYRLNFLTFLPYSFGHQYVLLERIRNFEFDFFVEPSIADDVDDVADVADVDVEALIDVDANRHRAVDASGLLRSLK